jgi:hypothetical protein
VRRRCCAGGIEGCSWAAISALSCPSVASAPRLSAAPPPPGPRTRSLMDMVNHAATGRESGVKMPLLEAALVRYPQRQLVTQLVTSLVDPRRASSRRGHGWRAVLAGRLLQYYIAAAAESGMACVGILNS